MREDLLLITTHKKSIVNVNEEYDDLFTNDLEVSFWVCFAADKFHLQETFVQLLIPLEGRLLESVNGLLQSTDLFLLTLYYETLWLIHIDLFIQLAKKVGGLDI